MQAIVVSETFLQYLSDRDPDKPVANEVQATPRQRIRLSLAHEAYHALHLKDKEPIINYHQDLDGYFGTAQEIAARVWEVKYAKKLGYSEEAIQAIEQEIQRGQQTRRNRGLGEL